MGSFLEGIESNTTANVVPPESYTAVAFPPSAESTPSTSVFPESTSSLMKEEDLFGERLSGGIAVVCCAFGLCCSHSWMDEAGYRSVCKIGHFVIAPSDFVCFLSGLG